MKTKTPARTYTLKLARFFEPETPADLTPLQERQLVAAGKLYFSTEHSAATLMAEEGAGESSFHGCLEIREIVDEHNAPAYTGFYYMGDSGTVFKAGTTEVVAEIIQDGLECDDDDLSGPLDRVLQARKPDA
jgi:hypothetical protein